MEVGGRGYGGGGGGEEYIPIARVTTRMALALGK